MLKPTIIAGYWVQNTLLFTPTSVDMVETKQQVMMLGGGLMVAFGFMFMGAASLSGLTPSGNPNQGGGQQQINATLPEENYAEDGFGLTLSEQAYLSANNQVVFVTAIYDSNPQVFEGLQGVEQEFNGRVYYNQVNFTDTQIDNDLGIQNYPDIIVVGDQQTQRGPYSIARAENSRDSVIDTICSSMRNVGDAAAVCY